MKKLMLALVFAATSVAFAKEAVWEGGGTSDWSNAANWRNGIKPDATGDTVWIKPNETVNVAESDIALFSNVSMITVEQGSVLKINFTQARSLPVKLTGKGSVEINGTASLTLSDSSSTTAYSKLGRLVINNGVVTAPPQMSPSVSLGCVTVNKPAKLILNGHTTFNGLSGDGELENTVVNSQLYFYDGTDAAPFVFSGKFGANCNLTPYYYSTSASHQYLTGTETAAALDIRNFGVLGVTKIGMNGAASSLGSGLTIGFYGSSDCRLLYLGSGETTDKVMAFFDAANGKATLDAGANGGVTFTGEWKISAHSNYGTYRYNTVVLTGSNTANACVVQSGMYDDKARSSTYFRKEGTGIWRFTANGKSQMGVMDVRRGTLEFDSLKEKGMLCALGSSEMTRADVSHLSAAERLTAPEVDYAFVVGDGETSASDDYVAMMKYIGSSAVTCTTRPLRVRGAGGIMSDTAALTYTDIAPMDEGDHTLVLGGSTSGNMATSVTNGNGGTLSVVKRGTGDWSLKDDISVKSVAVEAGTLSIGKPKYQYYRWMITSNNGGAGGTWIGAFNGFALMDADGNMQNLSLGANGMVDSKNNNPASLLPGEICCKGASEYTSKRTPAKSFHWLPETEKFEGEDASIGVTIYNDKPSTWPVVYFRLDANAAPIAKFDVLASGNAARNVAGWELSGSVDGTNWELLHYLNPTNVTVPAGNKWYSSGTAERTGFAIATGPAQSVSFQTASVAQGATLAVSEIAGVTVNELAYDAIRGAGVLQGVAFAANGRIAVAGMGEKFRSDFVIPLNLTGCTGIANLEAWQLVFNGVDVPVEKYELTASTSGISVKSKLPGLSVLFK